MNSLKLFKHFYIQLLKDINILNVYINKNLILSIDFDPKSIFIKQNINYLPAVLFYLLLLILFNNILRHKKNI